MEGSYLRSYLENTIFKNFIDSSFQTFLNVL